MTHNAGSECFEGDFCSRHVCSADVDDAASRLGEPVEGATVMLDLQSDRAAASGCEEVALGEVDDHCKVVFSSEAAVGACAHNSGVAIA